MQYFINIFWCYLSKAINIRSTIRREFEMLIKGKAGTIMKSEMLLCRRRPVSLRIFEYVIVFW